jgi:tetratricopeptide (TPR) repeat protein
MCLLLATVFVYGQKKELNNAFNFYLNGYLDRAKDAVDKAVLNDETAKDAKAWMYRGNIYLRLADIKAKAQQFERAKKDSLEKKKPAPVLTKDQQNEMEYANLCSNCAEIAFDAYMKAFELDPKITVGSMGIDNPEKGLQYCAGYMYSEAIALFEDKKYEDAYVILLKASKADEKLEHITFLLAYTASLTGKTDVAKTNYNSLIRKKTKDVKVYRYLAEVYKSENDTVRMLKVMQDAEPTFFAGDSVNKDFALAYSSFLSWAGKADEAADVIERALEKYPDDYILLISYGTELSTDKQYATAEKYLKRALELQPNEYIALFNLGNCYYNNYVDVRNSLKNIDNDAEYNRLKDEPKRLAELALPYLEKAHELDPKDKSTMSMLRTIYLQLNLTDKYKEIDEKLGN